MTEAERDALLEAEERIAIEQEGNGAKIDEVRRDTRTGELIQTNLKLKGRAT
jgi:hypothetical protein